jgi:predicted ATPase
MARKNDRRSTPTLIGREPEMQQCAECLSRARRGLPTLLMFEGEPGSGKTSLLDALQTSRLVVGRNIVIARIDAANDHGVDVVQRAAAMITHPEHFAHLGGRRRAGELARKLLPEWIGMIPILGNLLKAITVTIQAAGPRGKTAPQIRVSEDIEALQRYARRRPVAVLIDDLQCVSDAGADRLLRLLRSSEIGTRLLVVATVDTPAPGASRAARILLDRLPRDRTVHHLLGSLSRTQIAEWLKGRFPGEPIPEVAVEFLLAETGGQPRAVQLLLHRLLEVGALRQTDGDWEYDEALGDGQLDANETADAHLAGLRPDIANALRAASVFGDEFDATTLGNLLQLDELEMEDQLAVAVRFGLLAVAGELAQSNGDISTRYRFTSSGVRAALHRSLPAAQRHEFESRLAAAH